MKYKIVPKVSKNKWYSDQDLHVYRLYRKDWLFGDWKLVWTYPDKVSAESGIKRDLECLKKFKKEQEEQKKKEREHLSQKVIYKEIK